MASLTLTEAIVPKEQKSHFDLNSQGGFNDVNDADGEHRSETCGREHIVMCEALPVTILNKVSLVNAVDETRNIKDARYISGMMPKP